VLEPCFCKEPGLEARTPREPRRASLCRCRWTGLRGKASGAVCSISQPTLACSPGGEACPCSLRGLPAEAYVRSASSHTLQAVDRPAPGLAPAPGSSNCRRFEIDSRNAGRVLGNPSSRTHFRTRSMTRELVTSAVQRGRPRRSGLAERDAEHALKRRSQGVLPSPEAPGGGSCVERPVAFVAPGGSRTCRARAGPTRAAPIRPEPPRGRERQIRPYLCPRLRLPLVSAPFALPRRPSSAAVTCACTPSEPARSPRAQRRCARVQPSQCPQDPP
jgi:hypothetical protein